MTLPFYYIKIHIWHKSWFLVWLSCILPFHWTLKLIPGIFMSSLLSCLCIKMYNKCVIMSSKNNNVETSFLIISLVSCLITLTWNSRILLNNNFDKGSSFFYFKGNVFEFHLNRLYFIDFTLICFVTFFKMCLSFSLYKDFALLYFI